MYKTCPEIVHVNNKEAYYNPYNDKINIPAKKFFETIEGYYEALFHEMVHSTGHKSRLNRFNEVDQFVFGSSSYSKEELIAEIGAAMLCAKAGIEQKTLNNSVAYIQGWLKALANDRTLIVKAAAKAQEAVNYILNEANEEDEELEATA